MHVVFHPQHTENKAVIILVLRVKCNVLQFSVQWFFHTHRPPIRIVDVHLQVNSFVAQGVNGHGNSRILESTGGLKGRTLWPLPDIDSSYAGGTRSQGWARVSGEDTEGINGEQRSSVPRDSPYGFSFENGRIAAVICLGDRITAPFQGARHFGTATRGWRASEDAAPPPPAIQSSSES